MLSVCLGLHHHNSPLKFSTTAHLDYRRADAQSCQAGMQRIAERLEEISIVVVWIVFYDRNGCATPAT